MLIGIDGRPLQEKSGGVKELALGALRALFLQDSENRYCIFYNASGCLDCPDFSSFPNVSLCRGRWPNKLLNLSTTVFRKPTIEHFFPKKNPRMDAFFMPNINFISLDPATRLILTIHDLSFHHFPSFYSLKGQLWHKAINYRRLIRRADLLFAVSHATKQDIVDTFSVPEKKIRVLPPILTMNGTAGTDEKFVLEKYGLRPGYLLFLGTLEPRKNIESLLEAYSLLLREHLPNLPDLIIAGPVGWRAKSILRMAKNLPSERVRFLRYIAPEDKAALYRNASLFVFPSFYEGIGLPPMEAASVGIPVIASAVASLPEMLGDAALYINPWNVSELALAIKNLLAHPEWRSALGKAGRERMRCFDPEESGGALLRAFEETHTMRSSSYEDRH